MKKTIFVVALFIAIAGAGIGACVQHVREVNDRFSAIAKPPEVVARLETAESYREACGEANQLLTARGTWLSAEYQEKYHRCIAGIEGQLAKMRAVLRATP